VICYLKSKKIPLLLLAFLFFINFEVYADDITTRYSITLFKRVPAGSTAGIILKKANVLQYADEMPVKFTEINDIEKYTQDLRSAIIEHLIAVEHNFRTMYFEGSTAKELNSFIQNIPPGDKVKVVVTARELDLNEPIHLRSFITIKGCSTRLTAGKVDIAIIGKDIRNVILKGFIIEEPKICGIMFINAKKCIIDNIEVLNSHDRGMVIRRHSSFIYIAHSRFKENRRGGIMLQDGSNHVHIMHCDISGGRNSSNWSAGIVFSSVSTITDYGIRDIFDNNYYYPKEFSFKKDKVPFKNIVEASYIHNNQSSGIYVDGGNGNVVIGNYIANNDKEGICLDFYSMGNIVESNSITGNGFRRYQSDDDLKHDAVLHFGRLADSSAVSKLPNISLDNAAYNLIIRNTISGAAGDGVKIVRSGFRNIIGLNSITDNNKNENSVFYFSGVLLGSAGSDYKNDTSGIDALPSVENIVFGNTIYGQHKVGILIDHGSIYNDVFNNVIIKQKDSPVIELDRPNSIIYNNFQSKESCKEEILISNRKLVGVFVILTAIVFISSGLSSILVTTLYLKKWKNKIK
jgi:parallel beta-helix repeat protein